MSYLVVLEKGADGTWGAYVPDLPGCTAVGESESEARELIEESIKLWIETAKSKEWAVPDPTSNAYRIVV